MPKTLANLSSYTGVAVMIGGQLMRKFCIPALLHDCAVTPDTASGLRYALSSTASGSPMETHTSVHMLRMFVPAFYSLLGVILPPFFSFAISMGCSTSALSGKYLEGAHAVKCIPVFAHTRYRSYPYYIGSHPYKRASRLLFFRDALLSSKGLPASASDETNLLARSIPGLRHISPALSTMSCANPRYSIPSYILPRHRALNHGCFLFL